MVVWLVSQYRACQVASPSWTDRQKSAADIWQSGPALAWPVLDHVIASPHDQHMRARLSRTRGGQPVHTSIYTLYIHCILLSSLHRIAFYELLECFLFLQGTGLFIPNLHLSAPRPLREPWEPRSLLAEQISAILGLGLRQARHTQ